MDLDWNKSKKDLVQRTLVLIQSQECHDAEYNDEYDDSFDALGGHTGRDGEAEAESSKHAGAAFLISGYFQLMILLILMGTMYLLYRR